MTKILVTGCAGMIGFHLLTLLSSYQQYQLYGIDRLISNKNDMNYSYERIECLKNINPNIEVFEIDLCDAIEHIIEKIKPDIIVHLAADTGVSESFKFPHKVLSNNNNSFIQLLEAIRKIKPDTKLLYASSSSVYGKTKLLHQENNIELCPTSSYALSKLMNEQTAQLYYQNYDISSVGLRFFTVYGEYARKDMLMHYLLDSFTYQKEVTLYHNGLMERDFTYAGDVVNTILAFIENNDIVGHDIFNIGGTGSSSLNNVIHIMEQYFTTKPNVTKQSFIPPYDPVKTFCYNDKLLNKFPHLSFTSLDIGIKKLVLWYQSIHK